ncbi:expressed unknown protein [Seminavis robusta]|uniref:Uncharacterized protein n=1 Tax=Seminavis robusta TaxID=568900 RepID=A0A9N8EN53_9STRA|nr:expressed unknown protein [Seminavis robusta]|eukprot:Sro1263_g257220.1 n/a (520) ;mRNA; r:13653-15212
MAEETKNVAVVEESTPTPSSTESKPTKSEETVVVAIAEKKATKESCQVIEQETNKETNNHEITPPASPSLGSEASCSTVPPLSPPPSPSRNNNTRSALSPTRSPRDEKHRLHNTPQMMVLGKDASDFQDLMMSSTKRNRHGDKQQALLEGEEKEPEEFADEPSEQHNHEADDGSGTSWWKSWWHGKPTSTTTTGRRRNGAGNRYTSMGHAPVGTVAGCLSQPQTPPSPTATMDDEEAQVYYQSIDSPEKQQDASQDRNNNTISIGNMHQSILRNLPLPTTKEDQIQQDCSFLYRPVDERNGCSPKRNNNNRSLRAVLETPPQGVSTLYRDAQDVLSPPAVAQYQAKYHQLNQEFALKEDDRFEDYNDYAVTPPILAGPHDLTLEEQQEQRQNSIVTSKRSNSSLLYEQNGRVVLRLPRDHVRLLVASSPHETLEPGILSVIQCRRPDDPPSRKLEYCLTVPSNLYQRVFSEMSRSKKKHSEGLDLTVIASDHADIRVAIGIMVVILTILGIFTLVYGLD